jgi:peroxiredoxin
MQFIQKRLVPKVMMSGLFAVMLGACYFILGCGPARLADGPAPEFQVRNVQNQATLAKTALKGRPVVIDFWETWCEPCRQAIPEVQKLHDDYAKYGLVVVGISDESTDLIAKFARDRRLTYTMTTDPGKVAAKQFGVDGYPTMILIDPQGNIVYRGMPPDFNNVRAVIDRMVKS